MRMTTTLLAGAFIAGTCSLAVAQGAGGAGAGGAAGSDISTPKLNSGPGGTAPQNGPVKSKKVHLKKAKKHRRHM